MIPMPRRRFLALCALVLLPLAACGPAGPDGDVNAVRGEPIQERPVEEGGLTLIGEPGHDGPAEVACEIYGHGEHGGLRVELTPAGEPSVLVRVEVHDLHGDGTYEAEIHLLRAEGGSASTSGGQGEATLRTGTEMARSTTTHWVSAEVSGTYAGEAGDGQVEAAFERCFYFG